MILVQDHDTFRTAQTMLLDADTVAIDTETNGLYPYHTNSIIGISTFCYAVVEGIKVGTSFYFPFRHDAEPMLFGNADNLPLDYIKELGIIFEQDKTFLFHNAKFDLAFLRKEGIRPNTDRLYDTMLMSHMCNENESNKLKDLAYKYFDKEAHDEETIIKKLAKELGGWDKIPATLMYKYACKDAIYTNQLYEKYLPELKEQELDGLWDREREFLLCLEQMEKVGVLVDTTEAERLALQSERRLAEIEKELEFNPAEPEPLARKLFGMPPEGLGFIPGAYTNQKSKVFPKGRPVMDEAQLVNYTHPVVGLILEHRGLQKANSTWYRGFLEKMDASQRLHATYKQHGTKTTRLSCSNPNLQQLPRDVASSPARKLLLAPSGYSLWQFDYSQIEFRLAAIYAEEQNILNAYRTGSDFHQTTADRLGITRYEGKTVNFAILYGAGAHKLAETLGVEFKQAQTFLTNFHTEFPGFQKVMQIAEKAARLRGYVKLWTGRKRHLTEVYDWHKAFNSLIQGGAAEIVKRTMLDFHREPIDNTPMIMQVHDALYFYILNNSNELGIVDLIKTMMEWPGQEFIIPFPVDVKRLSSTA